MIKVNPHKKMKSKTIKYKPTLYIVLVISLISTLLILNACDNTMDKNANNTDTGSNESREEQPVKEQSLSEEEKREAALEKEEWEKMLAEAEKEQKEAEEKKRKDREKAIAEFPIKVEKVKIINGKGKDDNTYISLSVKNTSKKTINSFVFTYIGYDSFGEPRSDADDESFIYKGKIKPGKTLNLISTGYRWPLKDYSSEGWYDDYGSRGDEDGDEGGFNKYYDGNNYTGSYESPFKTRIITSARVSVYQAQDTKGRIYELGAFDREWSQISGL